MHANSQTTRRKRRHRLFVAIALGFVYVIAELGGAIAWWASTGELFTWGRAATAREQVRDGDDGVAAADGKADAVQRTAAHSAIVHPYLGYVHDRPKQSNPDLPISRFGFHGDVPIKKRSKDRFIVGIFGGSVAMQFGLYGQQRLREALKRSPKLADRTIEIVNLGLGGYKQPQQLMALQLMLVLGGEFDCVVNLDGFNEVALVRENVPLGVPAWFPRSWARLLDGAPSSEQLRRIGHIAFLHEQRQQQAEAADTFWWSPLAQFLWQWRDRDSALQIAELRQQAERSKPTDNPAITGPGTDGRTNSEACSDMVKLWQRASRQMHSICKQNGIHYFHFLQPNQYVPGSKPIGKLEASVAVNVQQHWQNAVLQGYPQLRAAGAELRAEGIWFHDLTNVFADHREPLYTDTCCHFGASGHAIVTEHVAAAIRQPIDLANVQIARLQIEPKSIEITSPLTKTRITVIGFDQTQQPHDLSGAGFGTRITAIPSESVQIAADGTVRATRRGQARLHIAKGPTTATVELTATWPDIFEGNDAIAPATGPSPSIVIDPTEVANKAASLTVQCTQLPPARIMLLATSTKPLPSSPIGVEMFGLKLTPITTTSTTATVMVPHAAGPGTPMFIRFYALNDLLTKVTAASNTMVVTRD